MRVRILRGRPLAGGRVVEPGQVLELPDELARDLVGGGDAEALEEERYAVQPTPETAVTRPITRRRPR
jgi:hypothetical protein